MSTRGDEMRDAGDDSLVPVIASMILQYGRESAALAVAGISDASDLADRIMALWGEPVAWRAFYTDVRGREVWSGSAWPTEIQGLEWCDKFKDLKPTLVPLYAPPSTESESK